MNIHYRGYVQQTVVLCLAEGKSLLPILWIKHVKMTFI